mmetsp:Transcript_6424/g.18117  ORF Transcript_6424/g.18117 Transcript_6424/m.18117 type:complete len:473 (-) Transcript_6424:27-1445(-)
METLASPISPHLNPKSQPRLRRSTAAVLGEQIRMLVISMEPYGRLRELRRARHGAGLADGGDGRDHAGHLRGHRLDGGGIGGARSAVEEAESGREHGTRERALGSGVGHRKLGRSGGHAGVIDGHTLDRGERLLHPLPRELALGGTRHREERGVGVAVDSSGHAQRELAVQQLGEDLDGRGLRGGEAVGEREEGLRSTRHAHAHIPGAEGGGSRGGLGARGDAAEVRRGGGRHDVHVGASAHEHHVVRHERALIEAAHGIHGGEAVGGVKAVAEAGEAVGGLVRRLDERGALVGGEAGEVRRDQPRGGLALVVVERRVHDGLRQQTERLGRRLRRARHRVQHVLARDRRLRRRADGLQVAEELQLRRARRGAERQLPQHVRRAVLVLELIAAAGANHDAKLDRGAEAGDGGALDASEVAGGDGHGRRRAAGRGRSAGEVLIEGHERQRPLRRAQGGPRRPRHAPLDLHGLGA